MLVNYLIFGALCIMILILLGIAIRVFSSGKPLYTKETDENIASKLKRQTELNREIGNDLKNAGWLNTRKWKKTLGPELYNFYTSYGNKS